MEDRAVDSYINQYIASELLKQKEVEFDELVGQMEVLQYIIDNPSVVQEMNEILRS